jgi:hypothetical protein
MRRRRRRRRRAWKAMTRTRADEDKGESTK